MARKLLRWTGLSLLAGLILLVASNCTMLGLNYASLDTDNKPAALPPLDAAALVTDPDYRAQLMSAFETHLYGPWPSGLPVSFGDWRVIDPDYLGGRGSLEEKRVTIGSGEGARSFHLVAAIPYADAPVPILIAQTFVSNCASFPEADVTSSDGDGCQYRDFGKVAGWVAARVFGEYIVEAPVDLYFDAGLAYAAFEAGEFVPDKAREAPEVMAALGGPINPTGALMAWGYAFSAVVDALSGDARIDLGHSAIMGHSRHGKAALLAAAWDQRINAVIAHQSGFGGNALSRSPTGERLDRMVRVYPHWLAPVAEAKASNPDLLPVDQHMLLALIAPRRLFLGNARRDVWSDPNSSFRAAAAASPAFEAFGRTGPGRLGMTRFDPAADLSWWLRPGGHSIVAEDIDAFIAFLSASSSPERAVLTQGRTEDHAR
jgi:hypothetical protein